MRISFTIKVDTSDLDVHPLQLEVTGNGKTFIDCYIDALKRWRINQPALAERFTLDTEVECYPPPL